MDLYTVFSNEITLIQVDLAGSYIEIEWFARPDSSVFREAVTYAHTYGHQHQVTKWLCNLEHAGMLEITDQHWLVEEVFPALDPEFQHHYAYIIQPVVKEVLIAYHILDLVASDEKLKKKLYLAIFTEMDIAQQWLFPTTNQEPHAFAL